MAGSDPKIADHANQAHTTHRTYDLLIGDKECGPGSIWMIKALESQGLIRPEAFHHPEASNTSSRLFTMITNKGKNDPNKEGDPAIAGAFTTFA